MGSQTVGVYQEVRRKEGETRDMVRTTEISAAGMGKDREGGPLPFFVQCLREGGKGGGMEKWAGGGFLCVYPEGGFG